MSLPVRGMGVHAGVLALGLALAAVGGCKQTETRADSRGAAELVRLTPRPGVTQPFILIRTSDPVAAVVLLPGGGGKLALASALGGPTVTEQKGNFLVRTKDDFAQRGLVVALLDAPSDRRRGSGMKGGFRNSGEHMRDLDAVIAYLRQEYAVPVWLVGTSRGTESAAQAAIDLGDRVAGVALTSSISEPNRDGRALTEMPLHQVRVPVLLLAHRDDACRITPPDGSDAIAARLTNAPTVVVKQLHGGKPAQGKPCQGRTAHGFFGIEREAVDLIAAFVRENSAAAR